MKEKMKWLPDMDLNHDKQIQSLLCYRYTIGQTNASKIEAAREESRQLDTWISGLVDYWKSAATARFRAWAINPQIHSSTNPIA